MADALPIPWVLPQTTALFPFKLRFMKMFSVNIKER
jgi:hypothetical protein